jgi:Trypsin
MLFLAGLSVFSIAPTFVFADGSLAIVKVAIQEGGDERITPEEYDARPGRRPGDFMRKYGATVKLKCPFLWSTANLVLKNDLVVTSAHSFQKMNKVDPNTCDPVSNAELSQCYVQKLDDGEADPQYLIDVASIKHPLVGACDSAKLSGNDIAYFRTQAKVPGVRPYNIYERAARDPFSMLSRRFSKVSAFNDHFKGHAIESPSISEDISIRQVTPTEKNLNIVYMSAVSSTHGNSGGGLFVDNAVTGRPEIFAVHSWSSPLRSSDELKFSMDNYNMHAAIQGPIADMMRQEAARPYGDK